jgi:uncharacterized protein
MITDEAVVEIERRAYRQRLEVFLASRDAGRTLTSDSLRTGIRLTAIIGTAAEAAHYADDALAIVNEEYRPVLHCKEGCCYCCCKPGVLTSLPEFLRILAHVQSTFSADAVSALEERARRYAAQIDGRSFDAPIDESVPCPFLLDNRCSVYDVRPLVCRGFNSTDVDACRRAHDNANESVPTFAILKDVTDGTTVGVAQSLQAAGFNGSLIDLGSALHIALAAQEGFSEAIIEGDTALAPAENAYWVADLWVRVCETAREVGISV